MDDKPGPAVDAALSSPSDLRLFAVALELATTTAQGDAIAAQLASIPATLQERAIIAIGRCKSVGQVTLLSTKARKADVPVSLAICQSLGSIATASAVPTLNQLATHAHPSVRREAMRAIATCAPVAQQRTLALRLIKDPDPTVRQAAVEVMGQVLSA